MGKELFRNHRDGHAQVTTIEHTSTYVLDRTRDDAKNSDDLRKLI